MQSSKTSPPTVLESLRSQIALITRAGAALKPASRPEMARIIVSGLYSPPHTGVAF